MLPRHQVQFYFSDSNLPNDAFLSRKISEDPEGYVSIALICTFARMRSLLHVEVRAPPTRQGAGLLPPFPSPLQTLKADEVPADVVEKVAGILRGSEKLNVSEDGTKVARQVGSPGLQKRAE